MNGYIHSAESFGTVDGPGVRFVVFLKGCPMRCLYCHNPDTWEMSGGEELSSDEILARYKKNIAFYKSGGITVTGGEPLLQIDFLIELFMKAREKGIHTCLDTSGIIFNPENTEKLDKLLSYTSLVMLDIKHIDEDKHISLTGKSNKNILLFAKYLEKMGVDLWVRHVLVPSVTDDPEDLKNLGRFIGGLNNLKALDVLPYHTMGVSKYKSLGLDYPLAGIEPATAEQSERAKKLILTGIKEVRKNM